MLLPLSVTLDLEPLGVGRELIPFANLLERFTALDFAPDACEDALARFLEETRTPPSLFRTGAVREGAVFLADEVLYARAPEPLALRLDLGGLQTWTELPQDGLPFVAEGLRFLLREDDAPRFREMCEMLGFPWPEVLIAPGSRTEESWPEADAPGIYRREHASLLVKSRTTSVLFDPIALTRFVKAPIPRGTAAPEVDAVVITHGHGDHYNLGSILHATTRETLVIVPCLERPNLLTQTEFSRQLALVGQPHVALAWGESRRVGDIEITALPFYGEQPARSGPGAPEGVRNMGNTYHVRTPDFSALVLVDSGFEPSGDMVTVLEAERDRLGPVDVVLSCMREFQSPFCGIFAAYFATLPFSQLERMWRSRAEETLSTTLGIDGLARVCKTVGAKRFLPYAHMFDGVGVPILATDHDEPSEHHHVVRLAARLEELGAATKTPEWNPGDAFVVEGNDLVHRPCSAS